MSTAPFIHYNTFVLQTIDQKRDPIKGLNNWIAKRYDQSIIFSPGFIFNLPFYHHDYNNKQYSVPQRLLPDSPTLIFWMSIQPGNIISYLGVYPIHHIYFYISFSSFQRLENVTSAHPI